MTELAPQPLTDLYLRLSDPRNEEALEGREGKLRAEAARIGWTVNQVIIENDLTPGANGNGRSRPASAFKRQKVRLPTGRRRSAPSAPASATCCCPTS